LRGDIPVPQAWLELDVDSVERARRGLNRKDIE
jgi:hypothetical protein